MKSHNLYELTPVEKIGKLWFKREDKFAPLGEGSVNGSKLRQLFWLAGEAKKAGAVGILSGAVSGSPQHVMAARVAKELGMLCTVISGVRGHSKYPMLELAVAHGASVEYSPVGYAKTLQSKAFALQKTEKYKDYFVLETNITTMENLNSPERIRDFHTVGAWQTRNIPEEVETLVIPAGSCNSAVSVLYGLCKHGKKNVQEVYLMGIGNLGTKDPGYILRRLRGFYPKAEEQLRGLRFKVHDVYSNGYTTYADLKPYSYHGVSFHPRYEGKMMNYLEDRGMLEALENKKSLVWIVGNEVTA